MDVIFTQGGGLDGHQRTVMAYRITPDATGQHLEGLVERKACGTMPVDLLALSDRLTETGITYVAMASTGEHRKPVFNPLAGHGQVILVNVAQVNQVPGAQQGYGRCARAR